MIDIETLFFHQELDPRQRRARTSGKKTARVGVTPSPSGSADWTQRYEALRAHALGEVGLGFRPLGLAVLRHRGVVGWMDVENRVLDPDAAETSRRPEDDAAAPEQGSIRSELVALLAGTALLVAAGGRR